MKSDLVSSLTIGNKPSLAGRGALASTLLLLCLAGCKSTPPPVDDATLTNNIQGQISGDSSLTGQPIQARVQGGVATLNGTVLNDAQRSIAARDAATVAGVREIVNNLSVASTPPPSANVAVVAPDAVPIQTQRSAALVPPARSNRESAPNNRVNKPSAAVNNNQGGNNASNTQAKQNGSNQTASQPSTPAPAQPTFRNVTVPSGNTVPVRVTQTLDSASTQVGETFSGVTASDLVVDGLVAIPAGSSVSGRVDAVQEAAHFKGASLLTVSLTTISRRGDRIPVSTEPYTVQGKGRGRNTAEKAGGGAAVGAILGGIFGGGKGAAIGAAAGGGVGAGANAITRGQQVQIPSESVVRFRLSNAISVRVRTDASSVSQQANTRQNDTLQNDTPQNDVGPVGNTDPVLQRRPRP